MEITNWAPLERWFRENWRDVEYLTIAELIDRKEDRLGRYDLPEGTAWTDGLIQQALGWLRERISAVATGQYRTRFRVYLYGVKGEGKHTWVLTVTDEQWKDSPVEATVETVADEVERRGLRRVEQAWSTWSDQMLEATERLVGISLGVADKSDQIARAQAEQSAAETRAAREQVNELVSSNTRQRISEAEAHAELVAANTRQQVSEEEKVFKADLAKGALDQLGSLASAMMLRESGVDPEMSEVLVSLQGSPELMAALRDPSVRAQLRDPGNLRDLATLLKMTSQQNTNDGGGDAQPQPEQ